MDETGEVASISTKTALQGTKMTHNNKVTDNGVVKLHWNIAGRSEGDERRGQERGLLQKPQNTRYHSA